ncbi:MAG: DUF6506 family protein [Chloroflexota bacterium]|nr:DUF6506 family protein [Chloroflexota bacterium]
MALKAAFIMLAPDGDPLKHRASVKTGKLEITTVAVSLFDFDEAVDVCRNLVRDEGIQALFLCAYFSHEEVARVARAVSEKVPVHAARSDVPGAMKMSAMYMTEGWFLGRD